MKILLLTGLVSAMALATACSTQNTASAANAAALPAGSGDTAVTSKNIVPTGSSKAAQTKAVKKADASKFSDSDVVCKRKIVTGSRFSKRVCLTRGEWKSMEELGQKTADDFQKRGLRTNNPSGG